jgi:hypothetical protein
VEASFGNGYISWRKKLNSTRMERFLSILSINFPWMGSNLCPSENAGIEHLIDLRSREELARAVGDRCR